MFGGWDWGGRAGVGGAGASSSGGNAANPTVNAGTGRGASPAAAAATAARGYNASAAPLAASVGSRNGGRGADAVPIKVPGVDPKLVELVEGDILDRQALKVKWEDIGE